MDVVLKKDYIGYPKGKTLRGIGYETATELRRKGVLDFVDSKNKMDTVKKAPVKKEKAEAKPKKVKKQDTE